MYVNHVFSRPNQLWKWHCYVIWFKKHFGASVTGLAHKRQRASVCLADSGPLGSLAFKPLAKHCRETLFFLAEREQAFWKEKKWTLISLFLKTFGCTSGSLMITPKSSTQLTNSAGLICPASEVWMVVSWKPTVLLIKLVCYLPLYFLVLICMSLTKILGKVVTRGLWTLTDVK